MSVQTVPYLPHETPAGATCFPDEIADDPWILYHGTSSIDEARIDRDGLRARDNGIAREHVSKVCAFFEALDWAGLHQGGYPVLAGFSRYDFSHGLHKPQYLAESDFRAWDYATREFAGGESLRALHYALLDLKALLSGEVDVVGSCALSDAAFEDLRSSWPELQTLLARTTAVRNRFTHGVIYAVRVLPEDLSTLQLHDSMGVLYHGDVPQDRLVAKVRVPPDAPQLPGWDERRAIGFPNGWLCAAATLFGTLRGQLPQEQHATVCSLICTVAESARNLGRHPESLPHLVARVTSQLSA